MIWVLSVWMVFVDVPQPITQVWQHASFETRADCYEYIAVNKVKIVDSILEQFRNHEGNLLENFEFFCENIVTGPEV